MTIRNNRENISSQYGTNYFTPNEHISLPITTYFHQEVVSTTVASDASKDTNQVVVTSATSFAIDQQIIITSPTQGRLTEGFITAIVGTTITITTPFEYDIKAGDLVTTFIVEMAIDGSSTRQIFNIENLGIPYQSPAIILHAITMVMITNTATEYTDFGDIAGGLTNGVVLRGNDGIISNLATARINSDLRLYSSYYDPLDAANPGLGVYGIYIDFGVSGFTNYGTSLRLDAGEKLEFIIQDDLSSLVSLNMIAKGHLEDLR